MNRREAGMHQAGENLALDPNRMPGPLAPEMGGRENAELVTEEGDGLVG